MVANENPITFSKKKPMWLARAMLGYTGLELNDQGGKNTGVRYQSCIFSKKVSFSHFPSAGDILGREAPF